jgi:hypothetical protein
MKGPLHVVFAYVCEDEPRTSPVTLGPLAAEIESLDLGAAVVAAARRRGETGALPEAIRAHGHARYLRNIARSLEVEDAFAELRRALDARGISVAALKGTELARSEIVPDAGSRFSADVDVLTSSADRVAVDATLRSLGYDSDGVSGPPKHLPSYVRGRLIVEVHEHALWTRSGVARGLVDHAVCPVGFTWAHLVHHAWFGSVVEPWLVAKTLLDVVDLSRAEPRYPTAASRAHRLCADVGLEDRFDALRTCAIALRAGEADHPTVAQLVAECRELDATPAAWRQVRYFARGMFASPAWYRLGLMQEVLTPNRATMAAGTSRTPDSPWLAAEYAIRPARLLVSGLRAAREAVRSKGSGSR